MDIHKIYIKPHGVKSIEWHTDAYRMEPVDIDQIIKDWTKEWKTSDVDLSDSDEETTKDKDKGKEKVGEKKEKERTSEKHKAPQEEQLPHKRTKLNS